MEIWGRSSCRIGKFNGKGGSNIVYYFNGKNEWKGWLLNIWIDESFFSNEKMQVTFMNSVAYNWSLVEFFLWRIMKFVAVSGWNSSGKNVNSQLKVNEIGIAKFQPRNEVSWLHFGGCLVEIRGFIYRVWSWLKILLIRVEIWLNFSRFGDCICCVFVLIDSPFSAAHG